MNINDTMKQRFHDINQEKFCLYKIETLFYVIYKLFCSSMVILEKSKTSWWHYPVSAQSEKWISVCRTTYNIDIAMLKQSLDSVNNQHD